MRKIRNVIVGCILILLPLTASAADTLSFYRLPTAAVSNLTDQLPVVQGDSTVRMTITLLVDHITDSLAAHTDTFELVRDSLDNYWTLIGANTTLTGNHADTITVYRDSLDNFWLLIQTNLANIATNTGDISTNYTNIGTNTTNITSLGDSGTVYRDSLDNYWDLIIANRDSINAVEDSITWVRDSTDSQSDRLDAIEAAGYTTDHGELTGLTGDDHTGYHTDARAGVWLATQSHGTLLLSGDSTHAVIDAHLESTANPHSVDETDILPSQVGNTGKYLSTDGTNSLWAAIGGGASGDSIVTTTDSIKEWTADHGIWIDELYIKDGGIGYIDDSIQFFSDTVRYLLPYAPIVDAIKDSSRVSASIGTINEYTASNGVTADGVLLKDGGVTMSATSRLYLDGGSDTYIYEPTGNTIRFINGSVVTLSILGTAITPYVSIVPPTTGLALGSATYPFLYAHLDSILIGNANTMIYRDGSGNLTFDDGVSAAKTLTELASGGSGSTDSSWTSITVDTIFLDDGAFLRLDDDGDTYFKSYGDDDFGLTTGGVLTFRSTGAGMQYSGSIYGGSDIGLQSDKWRRGYFDEYLEFDEMATPTAAGANSGRLFMDNSDEKLYFRTSAVTYDLTAGFDSTYLHQRIDSLSQDTVALGDVARLLADTAELWSWNFTDSAQFKSGQWVAWWLHKGPDTLVITGAEAGVPDGSPNFSYNVAYNDSLLYTGDYTDMWTTSLVVNQLEGEVDGAPNNPKIPPDNWVMMRFPDLTAKPPKGCSFNFYGYEK